MEKLYTVKEISEILQIKEKTVTKIIREKRLRASKIGNTYRISENDLSQFLDENKTN